MMGVLGLDMAVTVNLATLYFEIETKGLTDEFDLGERNDYNKVYTLGFCLSSVDGATDLLKWGT